MDVLYYNICLYPHIISDEHIWGALAIHGSDQKTRRIRRIGAVGAAQVASHYTTICTQQMASWWPQDKLDKLDKWDKFFQFFSKTEDF